MLGAGGREVKKERPFRRVGTGGADSPPTRLNSPLVGGMPPGAAGRILPPPELPTAFHRCGFLVEI